MSVSYIHSQTTKLSKENQKQRLWLKVGRGSWDADAGTRVWGRGTRGREIGDAWGREIGDAGTRDRGRGDVRSGMRVL